MKKLICFLLGACCAFGPLTAFPQQKISLVKSFVYGGKEVSAKEAPWQAVIYLSNEGPYTGLVCGATVISPNWILTAAHCFFNPLTGVQYPTHAVSIGAGSNQLLGSFNRLAIEGEPILHEDYKFGVWENDIALVKLRRPVSVPAIALALPIDEQSQNSTYRVTGWGKTETTLVSNQLLYAEVPRVSLEACAKFPDYASRLTSKLVCAGAVGIDTCKGDSGGPLYQRLGEGAAIQFGVTVAGEGCGINPGVYSRITYYRDWISGKISTTNDKLVDSTYLRQELSKCTPARVAAGIC